MPIILTNPYNGYHPSAYETAILGDSPVGFWPLNETGGTTVIDSTGTQNGSYNETTPGGYLLNQTGPFAGSKSVYINGSGYMLIPGSPHFDFVGASNQPYTFEILINPSDFGAVPGSVITKTHISAPAKWNSMQIVDNSGPDELDGQLYDGSSNPIARGGSWSGWFHAVFVRDTSSSLIRVYVNGSEVDNTPDTPGNDYSNGEDLNFGARQGGNSRFFGGYMAFAAVYNYALSGPQISAHHSASGL